MIKKLKVTKKSSKKKNLTHKQTAEERKQLHEKTEENWKQRMKSKKVKNMSEGAQNIARMIKSRSGWGNKQLWGNKKKEK